MLFIFNSFSNDDSRVWHCVLVERSKSQSSWVNFVCEKSFENSSKEMAMSMYHSNTMAGQGISFSGSHQEFTVIPPAYSAAVYEVNITKIDSRARLMKLKKKIYFWIQCWSSKVLTIDRLISERTTTVDAQSGAQHLDDDNAEYAFSKLHDIRWTQSGLFQRQQYDSK